MQNVRKVLIMLILHKVKILQISTIPIGNLRLEK